MIVEPATEPLREANREGPQPSPANEASAGIGRGREARRDPRADRHRLVHEWNDTARVFPQATETVRDLFETWARRSPDATGVVAGDAWLSYGELQRRAGRLAIELKSRGVGPEVAVAVHMERSPAQVIAALAILEVGAIYLPLDPANPPQRLAFMLRDAEARLRLTQKHLRQELNDPEAAVLCLDQTGTLDGEARPVASTVPADGERHLGSTPNNVAYILYTSGSTGQPKGVLVSHRAIVNRLLWGREVFGLGPEERILLKTPLSFDVSVLELFTGLVNGGCLVIVPPGRHLDNAYQAELIAERRITNLEFVPSVLRLFLEDPGLAQRPASILRASVGGEELTADLARRYFERIGGVLHHGYGPTEAAVDATAWLCDPQRIESVVPIGRPLANYTVHLLSFGGELAGADEAGELAIGGAGLARGYLGRAGLTAAQFQPDPLSDKPGSRLYRTGDLARRRASGELEFLGRIDHQVKVRGVRIEPGEITAALIEHPAVLEAAVVPRAIGTGTALAAYVVRDSRWPDRPGAEAGEHVADWEANFDEVYQQPTEADPTFDIAGWDSTYSGDPLPAAEMRAWLQDTMAGIRSLDPRRVLEIGCGTGMLVHQLVDQCEHYVGTDISAPALAQLQRHLDTAGVSHVELTQRPAHRFGDWAAGSFDTVILNSVVQYFPNQTYLEQVLERAVEVLAPGGAIFVGDVRSLPLLEAFHTAVALHRAPGELSLAELRQQAETHRRLDNELVIDPRFFLELGCHLPAISRVEIFPKWGWAHNELTEFRYQAILHVSDAATSAADRPEDEAARRITWRDWRQEAMGLERLRRILRGAEGPVPEALAWYGVPNARTAWADEAVRQLAAAESQLTAGALRRRLAEAELPGVEPEDLRKLAEDLGYGVELSWFRPGAEGDFEVIFTRRARGTAPQTRGLSLPPSPARLQSQADEPLTNDPLSGRFGTKVVPELRRFLADRLPEHMLPVAFVALDALPMTRSGKLDRRALPAPEIGSAGNERVAPRTPLERQLAAIWAEVLGVPDVGAEDDFFTLGGHSLLATQVISRLRHHLGYEVPLRDFFRATTVAALATRLESVGQVEEEIQLRRLDHTEPAPLSFAQERLWFVAQLEPGSAAYNVPYLIEIEGEVCASALSAAWQSVLQRHEALRTTFVMRGGQPVQQVASRVGDEVSSVDLLALSPSAARQAAQAWCRAEARRPFDLARGPLVRPMLIRVEPGHCLLLLYMHHIVVDGWSLEVLFRDLLAAYEVALGNEPTSMARLPIQYSDFALWQRRWIESNALADQLDYWRKSLRDLPDSLELITDHPRPERQSFRGDVVEQQWPEDLATALGELGQAQGSTPFMVGLAVFQVLLHRISGQTDIVVGCPVANRNRVETEGLIGFFANTLALRTVLAGEAAFEEVLGRVSRTTVEAYDHQDLPFERVVEALGRRRDLARNPLFQVMFQLRQAVAQPGLPELSLQPRQLANGTAKFDLSLFLERRREGLVAQLEFSTDLFERSTAVRCLNHYRSLLASARARPGQSISELSFLTAGERQQIIVEWASADAAPRVPLLHSLVEDQVRRTPDAVAVALDEAGLSYSELDRRADGVARRLRCLGVGPETRVGLCAERSLAMVVAYLGILKAEGVCVPLDPDYPARRLRFLRRDSAVRWTVADAAGATALVGTRGVIRLAPDGTLAGALAELPERSSAGDRLACVIYTSGSTGTPKGVMLRHASISHRLLYTARDYPMDAADRVLQTASLSFDFSIWECFAPLITGSRLVLARPGAQGDPDALLRTLVEQRITLVHFVPSMLQVFLRQAEVERCVDLRCVLSGGEALSRELQDQLLERLPCALRNQYGPTETTIDTADWRCSREAELGPMVPIGRASSCTSLRVLDQRLRPVPVGVAGELCVAGEGLARGYLDRPAATAERFVPDPRPTGQQASEGGGRLFRTGDRVRLLGDGNLDFLGRLDHQVKVRGFRIEPGEIEAALGALPAVGEAVVAMRALGRRGDGLVAYWVAAEKSVAPAALRDELASRLPGYMVPAAFVELNKLPRTPSGKIDRRRLPDPEVGQHVAGPVPAVLQQAPVAELLAGLWSEVLGLGDIGPEDDFFALGGHSLLATQVVSRLNRQLDIELPLSAFFEQPTVAGLAAYMTSMRRRETPLPAILPRDPEGHCPLSFAQERLWFLHQLESTDSSYNVPDLFELNGRLSVRALTSALAWIRHRHETLRTTFPAVDGQPRQVVSPFYEASLPLIDLASLPAATRQQEVARWLAREARRPFDLAEGPLLRTTLIRLADEQHLLLFFMHHIIFDAWSMEVLLQELGAGYAAFRTGQAPVLPELPVQYADYAIWQREWLANGVLDRQLDYWTERLAGAPPSLELPLDHPRPERQSSRGAELGTTLPEALSNGLAGFGPRHGATLFMTLLAAFQVLLRRHSGEEDIVVGSPISNRTRFEIEGLIGFFTNTLVLRSRLPGDPLFADLLRQVSQTALEAYDHQDLPFERLVEALRPQRDLARSPLFQVLFVVDNRRPLAALPGLEVRRGEVGSGTSKFDLSVFIEQGEVGLEVWLEYCTDLFDASTIQRLLGHYREVLAGLVVDPDRRLSELPLLTAGERQQALVEWADTATRETGEALVHHLFEEQARRTPEGIAVAMVGEALSYGALDQQANVLASRLRRLGVGPDAPVALVLGRTPRLAVAVLAVLKAGGAYLPLDPSYPEDRLRFMLEDSEAAVLVSDRPTALASSTTSLITLQGASAVEPPASLRAAVAAPPAIRPENLAFVLYTSGSTGRPKGVAMRHAALWNLIRWQLAASAAGVGTRTLQFAALSFDVAFQEMLATWASGGTLVLVPQPVRRDVAELGAYLESQRIERLFLPFIALQQLARWSTEEGAVPSALREVVTAGEALQVTTSVATFFDRLPGCSLVNQYGPTETHVVTAYALVGSTDGWSTLPPIGRPIANLAIRLLDRSLRPVGTGVPGELAIGAAGLARGYLGRAGLTAQRFVPDPWSTLAGARLYRTGDLARYEADGLVSFLGRLDHQVKVRGYRIEPGEIEAALVACAGIRQAAVAVRGGDADHPRLTAYVVAAEAGTSIELAGLRRALAATLPDHMLPTAVVVLEDLPRTASGKVDRRSLPKPQLTRSSSRVSPARTPTEELLAAMWSEVLGIDRIDRRADFFELGGHSLVVTRLLSQIRKILRVELPIRTLFENPLLCDLAQRADEALGSVVPDAIPCRDAAGPVAASFAQQRLWFLDRLEPGQTTYYLPVSWRLQEPIDRAILRRALAEVVRRHEALRTTFFESAGEVQQSVGRFTGLNLVEIDLTELAPQLGAAEASRLASLLNRRPFELQSGPLIRCSLLRLADADHRLIVDCHHIVSDGRSIAVLRRELRDLYRAFAVGRPSPLPALPIQYPDFAAWQHSWMRGELLEQQLAYWRQQLGGEPPPLDLPVDRPRPKRPSRHGGSVELSTTAELPRELGALGQRHRATRFMTLLAAFYALLYRMTGARDLMVGSPQAGRGREEVESLIGFFVNTLVLRCELAGSLPFTRLLERVRELTLGAFAHQDLPFEKLVAELQPDREVGQTPFFQVVFAADSAEPAGAGDDGLSLTPWRLPADSAKFDLTMGVEEEQDRLILSLNYSSDLFDSTTARRVLGQYRRLLTGLSVEPDAEITALPLLEVSEHHQLTIEWRGEESVWPRRSIPALFAEQARCRPSSVAVACDSNQLSYGTLDRLSSRLADDLRHLGVGPEVPVALCAERSVDLIVALLGILKAGGAYVPLDPSYPAERLAFMLADAAVPVLIADQSMASSLPAHGLPLIELDQWLGRVARQASAASPSPVVEAGWLSPQQLAYVVYTSGSTGRPKGVRVSHSGVVRLVKETRYADLGPSEILLQAAPVSFDASTFEIWGALLNGGRLVALSQKTPSLAEYGRALESRRISTIFVTTALFQQLVDQQLPSLRGLRQLLTGGEVMPLPPVRRMLAELPEVELIHCYGPTENTTFTTCGSLGDQHAIGPVSVPIGRSITNSETCVLDGQLRPVPIGFAGELYNGGVGLARDYHDRPGLTASRFVPHPHGQVPGARLYRTGDLVRVLADGRIDFLSRADHQVKLRGFRIEPGEIESVLLEQADIRQAAVVLRQDGAIGRRLVAYVAPDSPSEATTADEWLRSRLTALRVDLEARLPGFMIPSAIVALPTLPLSPTHKVDRSKLAALPAPEIDPASSKDYVAPRTPTEDLLANVWTAVLGREAISVTDDFFDLGGHSLLAIGLLSQVREVFEVDLPIAALFERPTIRQLAADIESVGRSALLPPIEAGADEDNPPLSFAQERFWLLEQLSRGTNAYCVPMALRLRGQLQQQALSAAFDALRVRHRVLRAIFPSRAGKPRQDIEPWQSQSLPLIDLRQLGESRRETELQRLVDEDTLRPFDVARGPLMRCILVRVGDQSHALLLNFHHIITDGWALGVLIREVVGLYQAFARRQPSPLPPLPIQYADFARWQKSWMSGEALDRLLGYWRTQLGERGPQLVLPGQRRPEPGTAPRPADGGFDLSPDIGRALDDVSRAHGVTLFMTGLAVFAALLARYSGRRRVIVGTPIANRNRAETEHLVGCFTNTLALAIDLGGDPTFAELLGRVRTVCLGAYAHQDLPFEKLVEAQNPDRDRQSALFDAFFSLSMSDLLRLELDELEIEPLDARQGGMLGGKFDLSAAIFPSDAAFTVGMTYDRELYPKGLIDRLLHDFRRILGAVAEHPETLLSQLPGPTLQERQQLTEALRQKPTAPPAKPASETPRPAPEGSSEGHDVAARRSKLEQSLAKLPPALRAKFAARLAKKPTVEKARMIEPRGTAGPAPLSLAQERLWFLDRLDPEAATYNVPLAARLQGAVDVGALGRALRRVLRRHEILRSRFGVDESHAPFQQTGPPPATVLPVIDLGTVRHRVEAARALMRREAARPFDLERGPVARFSLVRLASDDAYLMMTFHHIVFDAWSSELVFRELAAFYAAEHEQRPAAMPELAIQYADFAVWQRRWLAGERLEKQVNYWQRQLAGAPAVLVLPTDRPPGTSRTFHGQSYEFQLPVGLGSALARLKERSQATSFMVLLAAYQVFLQRLTGADDLTVGTPVSGRGQRETEGLVGFFVNILALRGQLDETWTFDQLLERVRRTTLEAYEHQDVPLSKLVEALRPERVAGQAPFFQVVLMVESTPAGFEMSGSTVAIEPLAPPVAKSDLTLAFSESPDGLSAVIEYNTDRFDPTTIRRWAADVSRLVDAALRDPSQRLAALPSSSAAERHAVLWEWNDNTIERHRETSFHGLFAEQARRTPDAIAVVGESAVGVAVGRGATAPAEELLSYGALDRRAEALARRLVDLGVGPDRCLALGLRPAAPMLVALFGVLKAGGAYLPLDPEQPAERSRFMLRDAGVESLITSQDLVAHWQSLAPDVACLSLDELTLDSTVEPAAPRRPVPVRPDHLAYVIYTSGSTGRPKGVMVRHRSLCNLVRIFQERVLAPYAGRRLQVAMMSSLVFDASLAQILSLLDGHTLHVLPDEVRRDVRLMVERLQRQPLDVLNFTPSHLRVAVESGLLSEPRLTPSLLLAGGEAMGDGLRQQLAETPGLTAYNMYGPTESTVDASGCTVRSATSGSDIGRPLANIRAYVLDSRGRSVALGRPGELCVAGVALARGYLARPGLTAERFVPHPYGAKGERLYRTGDLARWRPDGRLECLGRLDHQVKVRGFRIELGEIESALTAQPAVRQSVVRVDQDAAGEPRLVAYAVASTEARVPATLDISALRQALRQRLPEHMVPAAIVELDAFPRTSGDKIDRRALPAPEQASGSGGIEVAAPRDDLELQLVALFEEALSRRPLGIHDDFFALGGHSLLAVRLMARVEETLDTRLPLSTLFEAPTVAALAGLVRRPGNGASAPRQALVPIQRGGAARPFFCVHPVGGNVMCYAALARHLGPEQPFYGLQTPALNGSETHRIEEMAASYLVAVRTIQPEGPYALGGWSMGGWVAFEMARQLEAEGQAVDTLALIDSAAPSQAATGESTTAATRVETFARDLAGQWAAESRPAWPDLAQLDEEKALAALHAEARRTGALPPGLALPEVRDLYRLFVFNLQAAERYVGGTYGGRVSLLSAARGAGASAVDRTLGWSTLAGARVEARSLEGDHYSLLHEPQVAAVAAWLGEQLTVSGTSGDLA